MKLLVKNSGKRNVMGGNSLPAGVRPIEKLTSGFVLVDATDAGARQLRSTEGLIVKTPGTVFISPPGEFEMSKLSDIQRKLNEVKARRAKIAPR